VDNKDVVERRAQRVAASRDRGPQRTENGPRGRSNARFGKRDGESKPRPNKREFADRGSHSGKRKPTFDDRKDTKRIRTDTKNVDAKKPAAEHLTPQKKKALVRKRQFIKRK
jgi:hypothetical protein